VPTPPEVAYLRKRVGHHRLFLPTVTAVVLDGNGQVLVEERSDDGTWAVPGGIIDPPEESAHAAVREVFEETGVIVRPAGLIASKVTPEKTYRNGDVTQGSDVAFRCRAIGGQACVHDDESTQVRWCKVADVLDGRPPLSELHMFFLQRALSDDEGAAYSYEGGIWVGERRLGDDPLASAPERGDEPGPQLWRDLSARLTPRGREVGARRAIRRGVGGRIRGVRANIGGDRGRLHRD
jgi:8-oxo-dGTP pyrophosphatase MutT (NUDIX family)